MVAVGLGTGVAEGVGDGVGVGLALGRTDLSSVIFPLCPSEIVSSVRPVATIAKTMIPIIVRARRPTSMAYV